MCTIKIVIIVLSTADKQKLCVFCDKSVKLCTFQTWKHLISPFVTLIC